MSDEELKDWEELLDDMDDGGGCMELAERLAVERDDE